MKIKEVTNYVLRKKKVAVLHPGRCGSTVLGSLMNQHQNIFWSGELFLKYERLSNTLTLAQIKEIIKNAENIKISKIYSFATVYLSHIQLSNGCINMDIAKYVNLLFDLGYTKFIVIERSNHLKRVISILNGRNTNKWHTNTITRRANRVHVNPESFYANYDKSLSLIEYFHSLDQEYYQLKAILSKHLALFLNYENDIENNPEHAFHLICDFLKINKVQVEVKLKKTNPFSVKDLVENFVDIEEYFRGTEYEWMLYE